MWRRPRTRITTRRYLLCLAGLAAAVAAALAIDAALGDGPVNWSAGLVAIAVGVALYTDQWAAPVR